MLSFKYLLNKEKEITYLTVAFTHLLCWLYDLIISIPLCCDNGNQQRRATASQHKIQTTLHEITTQI